MQYKSMTHITIFVKLTGDGRTPFRSTLRRLFLGLLVPLFTLLRLRAGTALAWIIFRVVRVWNDKVTYFNENISVLKGKITAHNRPYLTSIERRNFKIFRSYINITITVDVFYFSLPTGLRRLRAWVFLGGFAGSPLIQLGQLLRRREIGERRRFRPMLLLMSTVLLNQRLVHLLDDFVGLLDSG